MADDGLAGRQKHTDRINYESTALTPRQFQPYWSRSDVKGYLHAIQGRICVYCGQESNGLDVEHFRPKATISGDAASRGYWWLAYEISNYLLACAACNRRKGSAFPLQPGGARCTYETRLSIDIEERIFLDSMEDPVEQWLTIDPTDVNAKLIPNSHLSAAMQSRVQQAIDLLGLNIEPVTCRERSRAYERAARAASELRWDELRVMAMRHRPHSLAAKIILERQAPQFLPSTEEEVHDLINLLWTDFRRMLLEAKELKDRGNAVQKLDQRQIEMLVWALVVIARSTSAGDSMIASELLIKLLAGEPPELQTEIVVHFQRAIAVAVVDRMIGEAPDAISPIS